MEWAFADNWSARIEYLHFSISVGSKRLRSRKRKELTLNFKVAGGPFDMSGDIVRRGLNYRFTSGH